MYIVKLVKKMKRLRPILFLLFISIEFRDMEEGKRTVIERKREDSIPPIAR